MTLYSDFQDGLYIFNILCNPKEAGMLNIRGGEITTGTALKLPRSQQNIRSSSTAENLISCEIPFIIPNGKCGQYYGAELELRFTRLPENRLGNSSPETIESRAASARKTAVSAYSPLMVAFKTTKDIFTGLFQSTVQ